MFLSRVKARYKHHKALWLFRQCYQSTRYLVTAYMGVSGFSSGWQEEIRRATHAAYRELIRLERSERQIKELMRYR